TGSDEKPVHQVTLSAFELARHTVTFEAYDAFCEAAGLDKPGDEGFGRGRRPVINISWFDAVAYCNWLSEQAELKPVYTIKGEKVTANWQANGYRLPTEAEWEYAAREGGKEVRFGNGKDNADPKEINFNGSESHEYSVVGDFRAKTTPVGSFPPNALGLYDVSGNVYEWCWDW
ncbi:MAG: SUMF1/EgtB/PvdO family nonheme iron enzyme, partial [Calditrichaeota bacterium]|nr:SUMF1/EgtB/PvdO family nonheme iron enzyme [Calditrichota bacterium]